MADDKRLIEDFLPIQAISAEASREKSVRKGHISTLHLWWVQRPLVACRAAVYGALMLALRFMCKSSAEAVQNRQWFLKKKPITEKAVKVLVMINQYKSLADCQLYPQCNQKLIDQFNYDEHLRRRLRWRKMKRQLGLPKLGALLYAIMDLRDEIREKRRSIDCVGNKWIEGPR